jgi:hypothetical protein
MIESAPILDMDQVGLISNRQGGGREAAPEIKALVDKALSLEIGQGFIVPPSLLIGRKLGDATVWSYKGYNSLRKIAVDNDMRYRMGVDEKGNRYIRRVEPLAKSEVVEAE